MEVDLCEPNSEIITPTDFGSSTHNNRVFGRQDNLSKCIIVIFIKNVYVFCYLLRLFILQILYLKHYKWWIQQIVVIIHSLIVKKCLTLNVPITGMRNSK